MPASAVAVILLLPPQLASRHAVIHIGMMLAAYVCRGPLFRKYRNLLMLGARHLVGNIAERSEP